MAASMETTMMKLENQINSLPVAFKYHCTSNNKELTRKIQSLTMKDQRELKTKLDGELAEFESLYEEHKNIDKQCMDLIQTQLDTIHTDTKMKDTYKILSQRYKSALEAKGTVFLGNSDRSLQIKSVMGARLLNFIITFHRHHCQYTNMFKEFCGDTKKEVKRLEMIFAGRSATPSSLCEDEDVPKKVVADENPDILALKNKITSIELDIDEDW